QASASLSESRRCLRYCRLGSLMSPPANQIFKSVRERDSCLEPDRASRQKGVRKPPGNGVHAPLLPEDRLELCASHDTRKVTCQVKEGGFRAAADVKRNIGGRRHS